MKSIFILIITIGLSFSAKAQEQRLYQNKGNQFNPSIGVNSLFLYQNSTETSEEDGMDIQEMELQFVSDVDSYYIVNALLAIHPEDGEFHLEPEEAFLETTAIPAVTFRVGKFRMGLGKHNQMHTHAYPFVDAPLTQETFLGEEGLQETGVSAQYLAPFPWYTAVNLQVVQGDNEDLFNANHKDNYAYLARLVNLFEVSENSTIELSFSGATGNNDNQSELTNTTTLVGSDLTFKYKPSKYKSFIWSTEYLQRQKDTLESGIFSYIQNQMSHRWFLGLRYGKLGITEDDGSDKERVSLISSFVSSEFSAIRTQYNYINDKANREEEHVLLVQFNMSIGAHPAHQY